MEVLQVDSSMKMYGISGSFAKSFNVAKLSSNTTFFIVVETFMVYWLVPEASSIYEVVA